MAIAYYAERVDFGGLAEETGFSGVIFADAVNKAGQCAAYSGFIFVEDDFLLGEHKLLESLFFYSVWNLAGEVGGWCPLFGVEREAAEVIEACPVDEFEEFVEAGVCFAGKADDEGCAEDAAGDSGSEGFNYPADFVFGMRAAHCFEDLRVDVLKGDVKIWEDFIGVAAFKSR